jgi:hypothetical protein
MCVGKISRDLDSCQVGVKGSAILRVIYRTAVVKRLTFGGNVDTH